MSDDAAYYRFHAAVHARPADAAVGPNLALRGLSLPTLAVPPAEALVGFAGTFEELEADYAREPRMFFEPDGSFVWRSAAGERPWQIDGLAFDRDGRLRYVELKGSGPPAALDRLLAPLGHPRQALMFQLAREAVFLDEAAFRLYAAAE